MGVFQEVKMAAKAPSLSMGDVCTKEVGLPLHSCSCHLQFFFPAPQLVPLDPLMSREGNVTAVHFHSAMIHHHIPNYFNSCPAVSD